jgi:predicted  nucleic acid-binding Zn-ribbon protein
MFKNVIAPIQSWLLSKGQCVGCGTLLAKGVRVNINKTSEKVTCKCGRIFIYDKTQKTYRRALFSEV